MADSVYSQVKMFRPTSILMCVIVVGCILVQARNPIRRPENKLRGARDGPVIEEKPIPSGAIRLKTGTYLFLNHLLSWESARMQCRFNGMDLVAIETPEENRAISMYARLTGGVFRDRAAWTGGCHSSRKSTWNWSHDGSKISYTNWLGGQNDVPTHGKCIGLFAGDAQWTILDKTVMRPFICELK